MSDKHKAVAASAFYVLALAAQLSGYTNAYVALFLALIGTMMLIEPGWHFVRSFWEADNLKDSAHPDIRHVAPQPEWLSLEAAAQFVYDETRHTFLSQIAREKKITGDDDPRIFVANTIISHAPRLEGRLKGATRYDEIPADERQNLWTDAKLTDAGRIYQAPKYYSLRVLASDLTEVIAYFERLSKAKL